MWFIWDIISVVIFIICIYVGVKKGFVSSIINVLAYIISAIIAWIITPIISGALYKNFFASVVEKSVNDVVAKNSTTGADVLVQLPKWISSIISSMAPEFGESSYNIMEFAAQTQGVDNIGAAASQALADPIIQVLGWFIFIILFILLVLIVRQISKLFVVANKIPVIGTVNMILGGALGLVNGIIVVILVSLVAGLIGLIIGGDVELLQGTTIDSSYIMGTFRKIIFG